jgi:hypothetical protein
MVERSTLLVRSGDSVDGIITKATRRSSSTTYVSFHSPVLSASFVFPSEYGHENDFSPSEFLRLFQALS